MRVCVCECQRDVYGVLHIWLITLLAQLSVDLSVNKASAELSVDKASVDVSLDKSSADECGQSQCGLVCGGETAIILRPQTNTNY